LVESVSPQTNPTDGSQKINLAHLNKHLYSTLNMSGNASISAPPSYFVATQQPVYEDTLRASKSYKKQQLQWEKLKHLLQNQKGKILKAFTANPLVAHNTNNDYKPLPHTPAAGKLVKPSHSHFGSYTESPIHTVKTSELEAQLSHAGITLCPDDFNALKNHFSVGGGQDKEVSLEKFCSAVGIPVTVVSAPSASFSTSSSSSTSSDTSSGSVSRVCLVDPSPEDGGIFAHTLKRSVGVSPTFSSTLFTGDDMALPLSSSSSGNIDSRARRKSFCGASEKPSSYMTTETRSAYKAPSEFWKMTHTPSVDEVSFRLSTF